MRTETPEGEDQHDKVRVGQADVEAPGGSSKGEGGPHKTASASSHRPAEPSGCAFLLSEDARNLCGLNQGAAGDWPSKLSCSLCSVPLVSFFPSPVYLAHSIKGHLLQKPPSAVSLQTSGQEPQEPWGRVGDTHAAASSGAAVGVQKGFMGSPSLDVAMREGFQSKAQALRKPLRKRPDTLRSADWGTRSPLAGTVSCLPAQA